CGKRGRAWSKASAQKVWQFARRRWNLDDVRLHDLRRTCASLLAISGENLPTIQSVLNHKSLAPTSIYARLNTKATDRALQGQGDRISSLAHGDSRLLAVHPPQAPITELKAVPPKPAVFADRRMNRVIVKI